MTPETESINEMAILTFADLAVPPHSRLRMTVSTAASLVIHGAVVYTLAATGLLSDRSAEIAGRAGSGVFQCVGVPIGELDVQAFRDNNPTLVAAVLENAVAMAQANAEPAIRAPLVPESVEMPPPDVTLPNHAPLPQPGEPELANAPSLPKRPITQLPESFAKPLRGNGAFSSSGGLRGDSHPDFAGNADPIYPADAIAARVEGTVLLSLVVSANGQVRDVSVAHSSGWLSLDESAVDAVRKWRGRPAIVDGRPASTTEILPVRFELGSRKGR